MINHVKVHCRTPEKGTTSLKFVQSYHNYLTKLFLAIEFLTTITIVCRFFIHLSTNMFKKGPKCLLVIL